MAEEHTAEGKELGGAAIRLTGGVGARSLLAFAQEHPKTPQPWGSATERDRDVGREGWSGRQHKQAALPPHWVYECSRGTTTTVPNP